MLADVGVGRDDGGVGNNAEGLNDSRTATVAIAALSYFHAKVHHNSTTTIAAINEPFSSTAAPPPSTPSPHDLTSMAKGLENGDARGD